MGSPSDPYWPPVEEDSEAVASTRWVVAEVPRSFGRVGIFHDSGPDRGYFPQVSRRVPLVVALTAALAVPWLARAQGDDVCAAKVTVDGVPDAERLRTRLLALAQAEGGCEAGWSLKVEAAPKGGIAVLFWNGRDLETRWARDPREVEATATLLLRVAVAERRRALAEASASAAASAPAPTAPTAPASAPPPPASTDAPPDAAPVGPPPGIALEGGVGVLQADRAGAGPAAGLLVLVGGGTFRVGGGIQAGWLARRTEWLVPIVAEAGTEGKTRVAFRAAVGLAIQTASDSGSKARLGVGFRGGPALSRDVGGGFRLGIFAHVGGSVVSDDPVKTTTTTTVTKPGNGNGMGMGKPPTTTTEVTQTVALPSRLGGLDFGAMAGLSRTW